MDAELEKLSEAKIKMTEELDILKMRFDREEIEK